MLQIGRFVELAVALHECQPAPSESSDAPTSVYTMYVSTTTGLFNPNFLIYNTRNEPCLPESRPIESEHLSVSIHTRAHKCNVQLDDRVAFEDVSLCICV